MANERVIRELIISPQITVGDREPSTVINDTLEIFKSSGNASMGLVTNTGGSGLINFNNGTSNVGVIEFDQNTQEFIFRIDGTPILLINSIEGTSLTPLVTILGDLTVEGITTTVDSTVVEIKDNIFLLNKDELGAGVTLLTSGFEIDRGSLDNTGWFYNESGNFWGPGGEEGSLVAPTNTIGNVDIIDPTNVGGVLSIAGTGALIVPVGLTIQQPEPVVGMLRFNQNNIALEVYDGTDWSTITASAGGATDFVLVAGDTMTGDLIMDAGAQIFGDNGAPASAPSYAFNTVTDVGIFLAASNTVGIAQSGSEVIRFATTANGGIISSANLDLGNNILINVADPTLGSHVGDRDFNDNRYLQRDGGGGTSTITGTILPDITDTHDLGEPSTRFNEIFATTFDGTATAALYSDLAERYAADATYEPGTVLAFGGEAEVTISTDPYDTSIAGIVSTAPGFMLNKDAGPNDTHPYIALKGRVPCKVVGKVRKGDLLVSSNIPGHAMSAGRKAFQYTVLGKAIEDFTPKNITDTGIIEVFVI